MPRTLLPLPTQRSPVRSGHFADCAKGGEAVDRRCSHRRYAGEYSACGAGCRGVLTAPSAGSPIKSMVFGLFNDTITTCVLGEKNPPFAHSATIRAST